MNQDVVRKQVEAMVAQIELLRVQATALLHGIDAPTPPSVRESLPERCNSIDRRLCALQDEDSRIERGSFTDPHAWQCRGCGYRTEAPVSDPAAVTTQ